MKLPVRPRRRAATGRVDRAKGGWYGFRTIRSAKKFRARLEELTRFIEFLSGRFKQTEAVFANRLELSERELALLQTLAAEGPMIHRELGARFRVPVSTMTGLVDRMEKKGLIRRVLHRRDRRSIELEATPAGALALEEHARIMEAIARGMLEALDDDDQEALITILRRVRGAIEQGPPRRRA